MMTTLNKRRFVIDTNLTISAALFKRSLPRQVLDHIQSNGQILHSTPTIAELFEVFQRNKFDRYVTLKDRLEFIGELTVISRLIRVTVSVSACRDPKDNKFLELALSGQAEAIITGDDDLLILHPFQGIQIMTPREFLERESIL